VCYLCARSIPKPACPHLFPLAPFLPPASARHSHLQLHKNSPALFSVLTLLAPNSFDTILRVEANYCVCRTYKKGGGDELEDDFEIEPQFLPEAEEEAEGQDLSKGDKKKQARKNDKAW